MKKKVLILLLVGLISIVLIWIFNVDRLAKTLSSACELDGSKNSMKRNSDQDELLSILQAYSEENGDVGLQATVIYPDGSRWSGFSGFADKKNSCPMSSDHHMFVGSITKLFTASMVMKQAELGIISLDEPISQWVDIPNGDQITIRMLLNHTSGLPSYTESLPFLLKYIGTPDKNWHPEELVNVVRNEPLKFAPGTQHEYSNSNYLILGLILENATQKSYSSLAQETIEVVGLENTFARNFPKGIPIANGYDQSIFHLGIRNLTGMRTSLVSGAFAAGDVLSTSSDVAEFVHALFSEQIISNASLSEMTSGIIAPDVDVPEQLEYGLGLRKLQINNEFFIGHTGTIPGYSGIAMHNREGGYTIVILSNRSIIEQTKLFSELHQTFIQ